MDIHLRKKDFKVEWYSGTGAGGQHRNKHQNCCRITHIETGISAVGTGKERITNQRSAFQQLAKRLISYFQKLETGNSVDINTDIIRNYNESRNEVHDKASGLKMPWADIINKNNIEPMIIARATYCGV